MARKILSEFAVIYNMNDKFLTLRNYQELSVSVNNYQIEAIRILFDRYNFYNNEKSKIDYKKQKNAYLKFMGGRNLNDLDYQETEQVEILCEPLCIFEECTKRLQVIKYNLSALFYLIYNYNREKLLEDFMKASYNEKHQILTRWMWILEQHAGITKGKESYNKPYLCEVGGNPRRKTIDREFHTVLTFIPFFSEENKSEFLLLQKNNGSNSNPRKPDFVVMDGNYWKCGIEVTEAIAPEEQEETIMIERKDFDQLNRKFARDFEKKEYSFRNLGKTLLVRFVKELFPLKSVD